MRERKKAVLLAALDWGLGHASRCIPLIRELENLAVPLCLGSSGAALALWEREFPHIPKLELPSYGVEYRGSSFALSMARQSPKFLRAIAKERQVLRRSIERGDFLALISDNRFGLGTRAIPSVFISHQVQIPAPWPLRPLVNTINHRYIKGFSRLWVPDNAEGFRLSGQLGQAARGLAPEYIGFLSALHCEPALGQSAEQPIVALLSGPEPQRSILEEKLRAAFALLQRPAVLIRGLPALAGGEERPQPFLRVYNYLGGQALARCLQQSSLLIARSGYSSLMDAARLGIGSMLCIPTPGQPEQEYLAQRLERERGYSQCAQDAELLQEIQKALHKKPARPIAEPSPKNLRQHLKTWLQEEGLEAFVGG